MSTDRHDPKRLTLLQNAVIAQPSRRQLARIPSERLPAVNHARIANPTIPTKAALKKEYQQQQEEVSLVEPVHPLPAIPASLMRSVDARRVTTASRHQLLPADQQGQHKCNDASLETTRARSAGNANPSKDTSGQIEPRLTRMGILRQQGQQLILCHTSSGRLMQFRERSREVGKRERAVLESLRPDENVVQYLTSLERGPHIFLGFEYCRFTLLEIIHVYLPLRLSQITYIAYSVSQAFNVQILEVELILGYKVLRVARFLTITGCPMGRIALETIRFDRACRLKLFLDGTSKIEPTEALALLLVDCVNQRPHVDEDDYDALHQMRQKHAQQRVFGVDHGERVEHVLVDFIEVLLQKPHEPDIARSVSTLGNQADERLH
ncbi:MAG: hypothetical protein Q9159_006714 [Coniocarpon cinnabarinum]